MNGSIFKLRYQPKLENTILIEGLPGFGNIGNIAAHMLIKCTHANLFAELYSPSFPDYVVVGKDGVCQLPKYEFFTAPFGKTHCVILTGNAQSSREDIVAHYSLCDEVLDLMEQYDCKLIVTMAGVTTPKPSGDVYVATTSADLKERALEKGATIYGGGRIVGAAGLLLGLAKNRGWNGICLLGTTTGLKADHEAAHSVLRLLLRIFGIENSLKSESDAKL